MNHRLLEGAVTQNLDNSTELQRVFNVWQPSPFHKLVLILRAMGLTHREIAEHCSAPACGNDPEITMTKQRIHQYETNAINRIKRELIDGVISQPQDRSGVNQTSRKLTAEQVAEIRRSRAKGATVTELALKHKVARGTLHALLSGRTYKLRGGDKSA